MIQVLSAGLLTTIQDLGRPGWQHLGVTPGGVMDAYSALVGNALVANAGNAAMLEITLHGPRLRFETGTWLAITGADLSPELDGLPLPGWRPVWAPAGACLAFGRPRLGCRAYLAVTGGFTPAPVLGSRSTDGRAGFGGLAGRPLRAGDRLHVAASTLAAPQSPDRAYIPRWCAAWAWVLALHVPARLRLVPGADWDDLPLSGRQALAAESYRISTACDRMGLRLQGQPLVLPEMGARLSAGIAHGALQLPSDGQPILLGVDRQTTGGYPVLGTVASVDHPRLAQLRPGDAVSFEAVTVEEAQMLLRRRAERLNRLLAGLSLRWPLNRNPRQQAGQST